MSCYVNAGGVEFNSDSGNCFGGCGTLSQSPQSSRFAYHHISYYYDLLCLIITFDDFFHIDSKDFL